ncbi:MAG: hypothetical protein V1882_04275 [Candidatus Omnitrophota bacterium]
MQLKTEQYKKEGMYLSFQNGETLDLSVENIQKLSEEFWKDPHRLPLAMRQHDDFKTCKVCPHRGQDVLCSAMKPLLPFLEQMEKYLSCDYVTAIYVQGDGKITISETDLQHALQYVTNMALFEYCEDVQRYQPYFKGIVPLMSLEEAIVRLAMNVFWIHRDHPAEADRVIAELREHVTETSKSCIKRLTVMCRSDAFRNAYLKTQTFIEFLAMDPKVILRKYFSA